jgi:hypothetical protein
MYMASKSPQTLPITDPDLIRRIERERTRRGHLKPTQTANTLLIERLTQLEANEVAKQGSKVGAA